MKPSVYILEINDGSYYIGSTNNIDRRLNEHRRGNHAGTRYSKTVKLLFRQEYECIATARKVEVKLKSFKSRKIVDQILKDGVIKIYLGP